MQAQLKSRIELQIAMINQMVDDIAENMKMQRRHKKVHHGSMLILLNYFYNDSHMH